jgi:hypothetical protein
VLNLTNRKRRPPLGNLGFASCSGGRRVLLASAIGDKPKAREAGSIIAQLAGSCAALLLVIETPVNKTSAFGRLFARTMAGVEARRRVSLVHNAGPNVEVPGKPVWLRARSALRGFRSV